jgi:5-formyltetrahydrofolate cyclo-ligase
VRFFLSYSILEEKQLIRERVQALRQSLAPERVLEAGEAVSRIIRSRVSAANIGKVCVYANTGKEIPTLSLMQDLLAVGVRVAVPDWEAWKQGSGLKVVTIKSTEELAREGRIVPQPMVVDDRSSPIEEFELFLVPGIAFDHTGNRLGMGGGYFDRLLSHASSTATFTGLAYDFQVITHLPSETHDIPVHDVVTPGTIQVREVEHKQEGKGYGS